MQEHYLLKNIKSVLPDMQLIHDDLYAHSKKCIPRYVNACKSSDGAKVYSK